MAEVFKFLAGPARVLIFAGQNLIGVGKSATETTFSTAITAEDIRAGQGNSLRGRYFHDASVSVNITYADFNLNYMALTSGGILTSGGTAIAEEQINVGADGTITLPKTAVAVGGSLIAWYRKPSENDWNVTTVGENNTITPAGAAQNDSYCVKYFYVDENAKSMVLSADYVPAVVHLVLIADEYAGISTEDAGASRYGKLIVDIPNYQLNGGQELSLTSGSAATTSLSGMALAVSQDDGCDENLIFGTITEQITGATWQDEVLAIAPEDGELELSTGGSETIAMRVVFKGLMAAQRKDNGNFTFQTVVGDATVTNGIVTAGSNNSVIEITLNNAPNVPKAYAYVTVS